MTITAHDVFWEKVDVRLGGCWLWKGALTRDGYGVCSPRATGSSRAHRAAYEICRGEIPAGLDLDHLCRVRNCVRPSHLEPVTRGENVRRGWDAGRRRPWLKYGDRTPARSWKPPPELYERFKAAAEFKGETMTNVLVRAAASYVEKVEREKGKP